MALKRLDGLKKRLLKDTVLQQRYTDQMQSTIQLGYAEELPPNDLVENTKVWYIPHHPVLNPKKLEKVRIVYDCAAIADEKSLNDFLMKGPDLTNSLVGVLLRFRRELIPIVADVEAMYYQVRVSPSNKDALRFFWWPEGNLDAEPLVHRMKVHLFVAKSSPRCASFCLRETAREFGKFFDPQIAEIVFKNFYADDCLVSVNSVKSAIQVVKDLRSLLS